MCKTLMLAALVPATAMAGILPAQASGTVHSSAVATRTAPGAYPLHAVRSSSVRCAGTLGYRAYAKAGKAVVGELDVYTTKAGGGTVIACFRHAGATAHKRVRPASPWSPRRPRSPRLRSVSSLRGTSPPGPGRSRSPG